MLKSPTRPPDGSGMRRTLKLRLMLILGALAIGCGLWLTASEQRATADDRASRLQDAQVLLDTTMYQELEAGVSNEPRAHRLSEFLSKEAVFSLTLKRVLRDADGKPAIRKAAESVGAVHARWLEAAQKGFDGPAPTAAELDERHEYVENLGVAVEALRKRIAVDQSVAQSHLAWILVVLGAGLALLLGGAGSVVIGRKTRAEEERERRDRDYRDTQAEFVSTMQVVHDEAEAHDLVRRHLELTLPQSKVVVLNRNNSANRLQAATAIEPGGKLAERLEEGAEPRACIAARLGRTHADDRSRAGLLRCELCGDSAATTCTPLLVSGEVIGSVLVEHNEPRDAHDAARVSETVGQASPVIGNLRNLAIAEQHASTDALTGLPNRRALNDTLRRMVAQAGRSLEPLSAIALDLDHFKLVNDRFGHERGDDVLAAVGRLLAETVRASDVAARAGGEEFCILLSNTDAEGAKLVAEKLRLAIARLDVPGIDGPITASFGVASYPLHGVDAQTLLRKADRALYVAKERGRDRVEMASVHGAGGADEAADAVPAQG